MSDVSGGSKVPLETKPSSARRAYTLIAIVAIAAMLASAASYYYGYGVGYSQGNSDGYATGFQRGLYKQLVPVGTGVPLSPGAQFTINGFQGIEGQYNISGHVEFSVMCGKGMAISPYAPCSVGNNSAEFYVEQGLDPVFNTGYTNMTNTTFSVDLNLTGGYSPFFVFQANPQNTGDILIFFNTPLYIYAQPPIP